MPNSSPQNPHTGIALESAAIWPRHTPYKKIPFCGDARLHLGISTVDALKRVMLKSSSTLREAVVFVALARLFVSRGRWVRALLTQRPRDFVEVFPITAKSMENRHAQTI